MRRNNFLLIAITFMLFITSCVKETYDMNKISKEARYSPTFALMAVKGNISLSDMITPNDTIVFDQDNFVRIVFREDSIFELYVPDFHTIMSMQQPGLIYNGKDFIASKGALDLVADIKNDTINLDIEDILSNISGEFLISNPSIKLTYSNSFAVPLKLKLNAVGTREGKQPVSLDLDTLTLSIPDVPSQYDITDFFKIDKTNSNLPNLVSLPPVNLIVSGTAVLTPATGILISGTSRLVGSLDVEIPLELRSNNLQFTDTLDNFLDNSGDNNSDDNLNPENFDLLRVDLIAKNGFPLGVSIKMSLYDPVTQTIKSTITADKILEPAAVESDGKANGYTETTTHLEFTKQFLSSIKDADEIIFQFTLNTTDNGTKDVKIYSDYKINFSAAVVVKPDMKLN